MNRGLKRDLKTQRFWARVAVHTFAGVGFLAICFGLFDVIKPNEISKIDVPLVLVVPAVALVYGVWRAWPRPVEHVYKSPNTEIHIVVGNLFDQEGNIVVGMADTFDTEIPHVISETSVQAQFLSKVYRGDRASLDTALERALEGVDPIGSFEPKDKKQGKQIVYPLGTVATLQAEIRRLYFCVAYTEMNARNEAYGSVDGVWRCLNALWHEVRARGNGDPISIPVIGGGQARISQHFPAQDSIRFIAMSFMFASRQQKISDRLNIVVQQKAADNLDMLELQEFLRSLEAS
jgi:hypothetical protein